MSYIPTYLLWLDRQPSRINGWPLFLSEESIEWLEKKVEDYLFKTVTSGGFVTLENAMRYWSSAPDRPDDLRMTLLDALNGVTYRAMLALHWEQIWSSVFPTDYQFRNHCEIHN